MNRRMAVVGVVAGLAALGGCGGQGGTPSASPSGTTIATADTALGTVLTGAKGYTLYMFDADTPTASHCDSGDGCSKLWPPATGTARFEGDTTLPGKLSTLTRSDGSNQVTYQGHALYTYSKDSGPHQTNGDNALNQWHVVKTDTPALTGPADDEASTAPSEPGAGAGAGVGGY